MRMSSEGRCGDVRVLRHVCGCGSEAFDLTGKSAGRWNSGMDDKGSWCCYPTLFKI